MRKVLNQKDKIFFWGDSSILQRNHLIDEKYFNISNLELALECGVKVEKAYNLAITEEVYFKNLFENKYDLFGINNNHVVDGGDYDLHATKRILSNTDCEYFGVYPKLRKDLKIKGIKINIVCASQRRKDSESVFLYIDKIIKQPKNYIDINAFNILYVHWGYESEYVGLPEPLIIKFAHKLIDSGFDLIVGHHPHVPQVFEIYKGKKIFYSIGNANYFISEGKIYPESENGVCVIVEEDKNSIAVNYKSFIVKDGTVISFNSKILDELKSTNLLKYNFKYYYLACETYLKKNYLSFKIRIKLYGIRHVIKFLGWLLVPNTMIYIIIYGCKILLSPKKKR